MIFVLGRERSIGFTEMTGDDYALRLKRSVIEGQEISEERLAEIAAIIIALLDDVNFKDADTLHLNWRKWLALYNQQQMLPGIRAFSFKVRSHLFWQRHRVCVSDGPGL